MAFFFILFGGLTRAALALLVALALVILALAALTTLVRILTLPLPFSWPESPNVVHLGLEAILVSCPPVVISGKDSHRQPGATDSSSPAVLNLNCEPLD